MPEIPDPNQLSIPSELVVRGDFTDRIIKLIRSKRNLTLPGTLANIETELKGDEIVLNQILKQFNAMQAENFGKGGRNLFVPGIDISRFFRETDNASRLDLALGSIRERSKEFFSESEI